MPTTSKKLKGHIVLGLSVRPSVLTKFRNFSGYNLRNKSHLHIKGANELKMRFIQ